MGLLANQPSLEERLSQLEGPPARAKLDPKWLARAAASSAESSPQGSPDGYWTTPTEAAESKFSPGAYELNADGELYTGAGFLQRHDDGEEVTYSLPVGGRWVDIYDKDGNWVDRQLGNSAWVDWRDSVGKMALYSAAAYFGTQGLDGMVGGAAEAGGMTNGAFLGENVASGVGAWDAAATSAGLDLGGGAALSSAGDMGGGDLLDLTHEGVNFGSETVGNGIKANASTFGPNYSNAAGGLGTKAAGGASLVEGFSSLLGSATAGDWLKTGVGVLGVMAGNDAARDLAKENREFSTDQTKANQEFQAGENEKNRNFNAGESDKTRNWNDANREDTQLFSAGESDKTRAWNDSNREDQQQFDVNKTDNQRAYDRWLQEEAWKRMANAGTGGSYSFVPRRGLLG